jgi:hypothetical protein
MSINTYDIFISYRHTEKDRAWAKWLLEALETYRVPKGLQQRGFPARIGKAFRDEDELPTSSDLSTNIQQALEGSKFLVVICSKDTPSSLWVDKEVATFRKLGKGDHIIPLLLEGTPETSFPQSLLSLKKPIKQPDGTITESNEPLEPIAADVRERKDEKRSTLRRLALLRILSAILGCAFDDLRQRDHERQAKKQRIICSIAAGLSLLVFGGSLYLWDYNRLKVEYYNTMVYRWGVPEGVDKLSEELIAHRKYHYRVIRSKRKVIAFRYENNRGLLRDVGNGEAEWLVRYHADGKTERVICRGASGNIIKIDKYEYGNPDDDTELRSLIVNHLNQALNPLHMRGKGGGSRTEVNRLYQTINEYGYVSKEQFQNQYGLPKPNNDGIYGYVQETDKDGLIIRRAVIDVVGNPMRYAGGYVWEVNEPNSITPLTTSYHDALHNPVMIASGYASIRYARDRWGNIMEKRYFGVSGEPVITDDGYHMVVHSHDQSGYLIQQVYLGIDGSPVKNGQGYGIAKYEYDERGLLRSESFWNGDRAANSDVGAHRIVRMLDANGNTAVTEYFDTAGAPVANKYGYHRLVKTYDERGNWSGFESYGPDQKPMLNDGVHKLLLQYDDMGNMTRVDEYGMKRELLNSITMVINEKGELVEERAQGKDGEPVINTFGYYRETYQHDDQGNLIGTACYGLTGQPVLQKDGYFKQECRYDGKGNCIEERYLGIDNELINTIDGYARKLSSYDDLGRESSVQYFNARGRAVEPRMKN